MRNKKDRVCICLKGKTSLTLCKSAGKTPEKKTTIVIEPSSATQKGGETSRRFHFSLRPSFEVLPTGLLITLFSQSTFSLRHDDSCFFAVGWGGVKHYDLPKRKGVLLPFRSKAEKIPFVGRSLIPQMSRLTNLCCWGGERSRPGTQIRKFMYSSL